LRFAGILILTYNATSLILPTAANITTAAGDTAIFISEGSGNWRCVDYVRASGQQVAGNSAQLQGYVFGLTATTNSGTPNTNIDIAIGVAATYNTPYTLITLASAITKNTNNSWAVGTGNGSLDTGAIANSTYYGYLIQRSDTGVVDVLTSLSATSPTMPANYDRRSPALFTFTRTAGVNGAPSRYRSVTLVQEVSFFTGEVATGTTLIPDDDTIPQITEGTEFLTITMTPTSAASILEIEVQAITSLSSGAVRSTALFQNGVSNALKAVQPPAGAAGYLDASNILHRMVAGTTSAVTFSVRAGPGSASTMTFNGGAGTRKFGGVMNSYIKVREYAP
jgi:hypothetical protein